MTKKPWILVLDLTCAHYMSYNTTQLSAKQWRLFVLLGTGLSFALLKSINVQT